MTLYLSNLFFSWRLDLFSFVVISSFRRLLLSSPVTEVQDTAEVYVVRIMGHARRLLSNSEMNTYYYCQYHEELDFQTISWTINLNSSTPSCALMSFVLDVDMSFFFFF